jgi:hypothetical protein
MIVVRIKGGLGNQLFQYASASSLAVATGHVLKIDSRTGFSRDSYGRCYRLDRFAIRHERARSYELWLARVLSYRRWRRLRKAEGKSMIHRAQFFTPDIAKQLCGPAVYLEAYMQSPRYFAGSEHTVRTDLATRVVADDYMVECLKAIKSTTSVSVHFRRLRCSRVLPIDYYRRALAVVQERVAAPHFFLFADDLDWAAAHLNWLDAKSIVRCVGPDNDVKDLTLMAACEHHVVANSTFSWWGAWLGNKDGCVVAPAWGWTDNGDQPKDLFPPDWIVL